MRCLHSGGRSFGFVLLLRRSFTPVEALAEALQAYFFVGVEPRALLFATRAEQISLFLLFAFTV